MDGDWRYDPLAPLARDEEGNLNNTLELLDPEPNYDLPADFDAPPSPMNRHAHPHDLNPLHIQHFCQLAVSACSCHFPFYQYLLNGNANNVRIVTCKIQSKKCMCDYIY